MTRLYCRRYKINCDPITIFKITRDAYDHFDLHIEPTSDEEWYWLDAVPYIQEITNAD